jgi:hypothetical protein
MNRWLWKRYACDWLRASFFSLCSISESLAYAQVSDDDILLVRLSDGSLARVYAPGLGVKQAQSRQHSSAHQRLQELEEKERLEMTVQQIEERARRAAALLQEQEAKLAALKEEKEVQTSCCLCVLQVASKPITYVRCSL